jgi:hypothetical protein
MSRGGFLCLIQIESQDFRGAVENRLKTVTREPNISPNACHPELRYSEGSCQLPIVRRSGVPQDDPLRTIGKLLRPHSLLLQDDVSISAKYLDRGNTNSSPEMYHLRARKRRPVRRDCRYGYTSKHRLIYLTILWLIIASSASAQVVELGYAGKVTSLVADPAAG